MSLIAAALVIAAQATKPDPLPPCDRARAERGVQSAMNFCAHRDYLKADRALNVQWTKTAAAMRAMDRGDFVPDDGRPGYFDTLLKSQRAWIAYRNAHCTSAGYQARGGTMEPMLVSFCLTDLTEQRIKQLRQLAEKPE
jgi:uncharacterized protein YecT (DUF1311 family)